MGHLLEQDSLRSSCAEVLLEVGTHRAQPARTEQHPRPEPGAVDSMATFLWLLLGNISRPFAVQFPGSEQTLAESVPLRGWIRPWEMHALCRVLCPLTPARLRWPILIIRASWRN